MSKIPVRIVRRKSGTSATGGSYTSGGSAVTADSVSYATSAGTASTSVYATSAGEAGHAAAARDLDSNSPVWAQIKKMGGNYIHKDQDDETAYTLTMAGAKVTGAATIGGTMSADAANVNALDVADDAAVGGALTVGGSTELRGDVKAKGDTTFGEFSEGGLSAPTLGAKIDKSGNGDMRSLRLWEWLEVPELRYNRVNVYTGIRWDTFGAGIIEAVDTEKKLITLKLEDGEAGAIAKKDLCMGIWHDSEDEDGNATATTDDKEGNFTFKGFKTVYFQIVDVPEQIGDAVYLVDDSGDTLTDADGEELIESSSIVDNSTLKYFYYELGNGCTTHPFVGMHFAARGNTTNSKRQSFTYTTTEYSLMLQGVNQWKFTDSMIVAIQGKLDGFRMKEFDGSDKYFEGTGLVFGNAYIYGTISQFERAGVRVEYSGATSIKLGEAYTYTLTAYKAFDAVAISKISVSKSGTGGTVPVSSYTYNSDGTASFSLTMSADYTGNDYTLTVTATTDEGEAKVVIPVVIVRDGEAGTSVPILKIDAIGSQYNLNASTGLVESVSVNGTEITLPYLRGLNVALINATSGDVVYTKSYDTFGGRKLNGTALTSAEWQQLFIDDLGGTDNGFSDADNILVIVSRDAFYMTKAMHEALKAYGDGSDFIVYDGNRGTMHYRSSYAFIGRYGIKEGAAYYDIHDRDEMVKAEVTADVVNGFLILNGVDGTDGADGTTIKPTTTEVSYGTSASSTTQPTSWSSTQPALTKGVYLWTRTRIGYDDGTYSDYVYSVSYIAVDGTTYYTYFAYATSDSGADFSTTSFDGATYLGVCTTTLGTQPTDAASYTWTLVKGDKGADGRILRPCGKWALLTEYVNNDSFVDVVIYNNTYYACKKTNKNIFPINTTYWEKANEMKFVATDLLLAEEAYIKNLAVKKVSTSTQQNTQRTVIEGNTFEIYGTEDTPNIKVGIDDNGIAYFQFLKNGSVIWELSPSGLNKVKGQGEAWEIEQMVCVNNLDAQAFSALTSADLYPEYRYYAAWDYDANGDVIWKLTGSTDEPVYNQRLHEYGAKTLGTYVEDGWYIIHEDGMIKTSYSNTMSRFVYLVVDGVVGDKQEVFFKSTGSDFYTDYSGGTTCASSPLTYPLVSTTSEDVATTAVSDDTTSEE